MKNTMDYMVGSTAFQIISKGNKIKVINVEKEKKRKQFARRCVLCFLSGLLVFGSCFYVVSLNHTRGELNRQVYSLRDEVNQMEEENCLLTQQEEQKKIDYNKILVKAKALGMDFPKKNQVFLYTVSKSSAVRVNPLFLNKS